MLNITDIRELTDEEKEKFRLEKEIEAKKRELDDLNSKIESIKNTEHKDKTDKKFSLTDEEKVIVSDAIKQDKEKDEQVSEEIRQIIEKSNQEYLELEKEYNKVKPSKRTLILAISLAILIIFVRILGMNMVNNTNSISNIDNSNLTVMVPNSSNNTQKSDTQENDEVDYIVNIEE